MPRMETYSMETIPEKECNVCGRQFYASKNCPCPMAKCNGVMHTIITPVAGKRLKGTLRRNESPILRTEQRFISSRIEIRCRDIGLGQRVSGEKNTVNSLKVDQRHPLY